MNDRAINTIVEKLKRNGFTVTDPFEITESYDKKKNGKYWLSAHNNKKNIAFSLLYNYQDHELIELHINSFNFCLDNGYQSSELRRLSELFAGSVATEKRQSKRRGLLPFFHFFVTTTWKFENGLSLELAGYEDGSYNVNKRDVAILL